jgi:hypothetical protein
VCVRFRPEAALAAGKLTRGGTGGQPTHRKSLCLGRRLYALAEQIATYEPLWAWLGGTYTLHGGLMVVGGLMFGWWALRAWWR